MTRAASDFDAVLASLPPVVRAVLVTKAAQFADACEHLAIELLTLDVSPTEVQRVLDVLLDATVPAICAELQAITRRE